MTQNKTKVFLLHNIAAPYRLPLFDELGKRVDLDVFFCRQKERGRLWEIDLDKYSFKREILKNVSLGPFVVNYTLTWKLLKNRPQVYLVGENGFETMFSIVWIFFFSKLFKTPMIVWSEKVEDEWTKRQIKGIRRYAELILAVYRKFLYTHSNAFVAYSKKAKEYLLKEGVLQETIFVGGQHMPEECLQKVEVSKEDTEYKDKLIILTVCYLSRRKGIDCLIQAFKEVNFDGAILVIAGLGEEKTNLRMLAGNTKNIFFVGHVDGIEKYKWYSIADIFVLPTFHDPWGLVVNEAMYFGLPIITTEVAGCSEMVKDNGFVIPPGDEEALKRALMRLLEDANLRATMGRRSREYVKEYNVSNAVKPFIEAINLAVHSMC